MAHMCGHGTPFQCQVPTILDARLLRKGTKEPRDGYRRQPASMGMTCRFGSMCGPLSVPALCFGYVLLWSQPETSQSRDIGSSGGRRIPKEDSFALNLELQIFNELLTAYQVSGNQTSRCVVLRGQDHRRELCTERQHHQPSRVLLEYELQETLSMIGCSLRPTRYLGTSQPARQSTDRTRNKITSKTNAAHSFRIGVQVKPNTIFVRPMARLDSSHASLYIRLLPLEQALQPSEYSSEVDVYWYFHICVVSLVTMTTISDINRSGHDCREQIRFECSTATRDEKMSNGRSPINSEDGSFLRKPKPRDDEDVNNKPDHRFMQVKIATWTRSSSCEVCSSRLTDCLKGLCKIFCVSLGTLQEPPLEAAMMMPRTHLTWTGTAADREARCKNLSNGCVGYLEGGGPSGLDNIRSFTAEWQ